MKFFKIKIPEWLIVVIAFVLIFRIPSFFEPYSYGDEMIYLNLGEAVRRGVPLYKSIHDNKPPLLYFTAALAGNLLMLRVILTIWMLMTILLFWKLCTTLFPKNIKLHKFAIVIFSILTTIPLLEGNIANSELFMIGPTILAFQILLSKRSKVKKNIFIAGLLLSIATLFKVPAAFDIPAIIFLWFVGSKLKRKDLSKLGRNIGILMLGFLTPILLTMLWYLSQGALKEYIVAAFLQNVGYLSSWRPSDVVRPFVVRNLPLIIRGLSVFIGLVILYLKRKSLSKQFIFITAWLLFSLFAVSLSERPYPHYLVQSVPSISLLFAILFTGKNLEQSLTVIPLTLVFIVAVYYNVWHYPTLPYYLRFVKYLSGRISTTEYMSSFGDNVMRNYQVSALIRRHTDRNDRVFVWGDSSTVYAISKRLPPIKYVADYHISDFSSREEVLKAVADSKPKMIVELSDAPTFPELSEFLDEYYFLIGEREGSRIWYNSTPN
jgi:hypothetical protein